MTKASLITSINGYITAVITQAKHRLSMLDLVNTLYPTTVTESYTNLATTVTNTTPIGTTHYYTTYWKKQGSIVHIKGHIINKTGVMASNTDWITIATAEFLPVALPNVNASFVTGFSESDNRPIIFDIKGTTIKLVSAIANNETILIDFKYYAE